MEQKNKKIISILVEDEFGALSRIIELSSEKGNLRNHPDNQINMPITP